MKKKIFEIFLGVILAVLPLLSLAQVTGPNECCRLVRDFGAIDPACVRGSVVGPRDGICNVRGGITVATDSWSQCCVMNTITNITNWLFYAFLGVVIILAVWIAFSFLTAGGDPEKVKSTREKVLYLVIAVVVAAVARLLPGFIERIVAG